MSQVLVREAFTILPADADKRTVIRLLAEALARCGRLTSAQVETVVEEAMKREVIGSTGIGHGIAVPHCRAPLSDRILCSYGHCPEGLDFDSLDGEPVHSVFLLVTPPALKDQHLQLMKHFAGLIRKEHFCGFLHQAASFQALRDLLVEFEAR
ncbi:MAG: PTS sugar transporter subunit IIA [Planctomycetota bacterium]|nr:PTS sugar transporter subunit IIA [Planctomycetota bacterium]MDW8372420.1 PTS sugar transporter subunit IIA [Planctomycetota bacterium]